MSSISLLVALVGLLSSCAHVRLDAASLLSPDRGPGTAKLEAGYRIEQGIILDGELVIGITHAHRPGNRIVILFCGGDSFRRSQQGGLVLQALTIGADVVLFDYPGYGDSTGEPTPTSLVDAARAVHRFIAGLPETRSQRLVVYGFSMGGMVAAQLAGRTVADAVVLESTAADVASWARTQVPWYLVPFVRVDIDPVLQQIDNVEALSAFSGTVLLLSGSRDRRAPVSLSRDMHRRLRAVGVRVELVEIAGGDHGDLHRSAEFRPALERFLASP